MPNLEYVCIDHDDWNEEVKVFRKYLTDVLKWKIVIANEKQTKYLKCQGNTISLDYAKEVKRVEFSGWDGVDLEEKF